MKHTLNPKFYALFRILRYIPQYLIYLVKLLIWKLKLLIHSSFVAKRLNLTSAHLPSQPSPNSLPPRPRYLFVFSATLLVILSFVAYYLIKHPLFTLADTRGDAPIAYWKFDEGYGATAQDSSSNNYDGTITGADWVDESQCLSGKCLYFNGTTSDYVDVGASSRYGSGDTSGSYTIEAWVRVNQIGRYNVVTHHLGGFDYFSAGTSTGGSEGKLRTMVWDATHSVNYWPISTGSITANSWTHLVFVFEHGAGYKFYINGQLDKEFTNTDLAFHNYDATAYLGLGFDANSYFKGYMDEVKVYNYTRSADQIKTIMNQGASVRYGPSTGSP